MDFAERRGELVTDDQLSGCELRDHGVIGNLSTLALVAMDGSIDFLCWPDFDSPSVFAGLLDRERGGIFRVWPDLPGARVTQHYLSNTNVLVTRWMSETASVELTDFMAVGDDECSNHFILVRRLRVTRGQATIRMICHPRFDYARQESPVICKQGDAYWQPDENVRLRLHCTRTLIAQANDVALSALPLSKGDQIDFVLSDVPDDESGSMDAAKLENETTTFWQAWADRSTYRGRWRELVARSALALKLLTSRRHGSIIAAGTFGLPEAPGGARNWDYRATWIRDASFTTYALMRLGYRNEAQAFNHWMGERARECDCGGRLGVMYAMDGRSIDLETTLPHLRGYDGATPVRIGNDAKDQLQLDIYGELMDSVYLSNKYGQAISHDGWTGVRQVIDYVCKNWRKPDAGIWEMRGPNREFLHSRLMCWVAVDRAIRLANKRSLAAPFTEWQNTRNEIYDDIWENFWSERKGHFIQARGSEDLDASLLLMPLVRFISATDPRWLSTLDAIGSELADDGIVYRYKMDDGLEGREGGFAACSFWYAECLARAGRLPQAQRVFEAALTYANHLGLYAEEFNLKGEIAGNFPQALSHLAMISAAFYLDRSMDQSGSQEWKS